MNHVKLKRSDLDSVRTELMVLQNNTCPICTRSFDGFNKSGTKLRACVDHDHKTGQVRGVLCSSCNAFEGIVRQKALRQGLGHDLNKILINLVKYLEQEQHEMLYPVSVPRKSVKKAKTVNEVVKAKLTKIRKPVSKSSKI